MINERKIIAMTKLAIYEKNMAEADKKTDGYFLHDYIYKQNMWTRIFVLIGLLIVIMFRWLHKLLIVGVDLFAFDYQKELLDIGIYVVVVLVAYSIIGMIQSTIEYKASQNRIKAYLQLLSELERRDAQTGRDTKEALDTDYGSSIVYTRDND